MAKRYIRGFCLFAASGLLAACNQGPPVEVDAAKIEQTLYWSRSLQDKRIAIEGYIGFDNGATGQAIAGGPILRTQPYGAGQELLMIGAEFGSGPNQISSPGMTSKPMFDGAPKDLPQVVTVNPNEMSYFDTMGAPHPINHRVRVIGKLRYALDIKDDTRSPTGQRYRPFMTDVTLEAPPGS